MIKQNSKKTFYMAGWALFAACLAYYSFLCARLSYWQTIQLNGAFPSDTGAHLAEALVGEAYSLMENIFAFVFSHLGGAQSAGICLGLVYGLTVLATGELIHEFLKKQPRLLSYILAFLCSFSASYFLPTINAYRYVGIQGGNVYHNMTYTGMKLFGVLAMLFYLQAQKVYEQKLGLVKWGLFMISMILVCAMKPNFLVCFAPAMGICLLIDLIANKGKTFPKIFWFGLAVIPAVAVLIYDYMFLFPGSGDSGGLMIEFGYSISLNCATPWAGPIQAMAFPLWILLFHLKDLKKDHGYGFSWMMTLIAFLEYLFIVESGRRKNHGNLSWGYCFCIFVVFAVSSAKLSEDISLLFSPEKGTDGKRPHPWWFYLISLILWAGHIYFGLKYFRILLLGGSYY